MTVSADYYGRENYDYSNTGNNEYQVWIDGKISGSATKLLDDASLAECMDRCDELTDCEGVTVTAEHDGEVECYRKGDVSLGDCDWFPPVNTSTSSSQ
mmetsp:Transcript_27381/g.46277  ORF Transcript_27381/g.46277 Transcript_27381/m.46277 type:complete len:98 (-) Transcript_27381:7-300(-)